MPGVRSSPLSVAHLHNPRFAIRTGLAVSWWNGGERDDGPFAGVAEDLKGHLAVADNHTLYIRGGVGMGTAPSDNLLGRLGAGVGFRWVTGPLSVLAEMAFDGRLAEAENEAFALQFGLGGLF